METSSKIIYSLFLCILLFMVALVNIDVFPTNDMSLFWLLVISNIIIGVLAIVSFVLVFTSETIHGNCELEEEENCAGCQWLYDCEVCIHQEECEKECEENEQIY